MRLYIKSCRLETSTPFQNNIENPILTLHNQYDHKVKNRYMTLSLATTCANLVDFC
jgi:hypothetical protein